MRAGVIASPLLHAIVIAAGLYTLPRVAPELPPAEVVPIEIVTIAEETNVRAASPEVAEVSDVFEDKGETLIEEPPPPPEEADSVDPVPTPTPPRPQREREPRLNLSQLNEQLQDREQKEFGDADRDASPGGERAERPRAAQGQATALTATQTARINALMSEQISRCARSTADRADRDLVVIMRIRLATTGDVVGQPQIRSGSGNDVYDSEARRAVLLCAPYDLGDLQPLVVNQDIDINYRPR